MQIQARFSPPPAPPRRCVRSRWRQSGRLSWLAAGPVGFSPGAGLAEGAEPSADDPFAHLSVQFIPENVTTVQRQPRRDEVAQRLVYEGSARFRDSLAATGLPPVEAEQAARLLAAAGVQPGRTLGIETAATSPGSPVREILRISADVGGRWFRSSRAMTPAGSCVSPSPPTCETPLATLTRDRRQRGRAALARAVPFSARCRARRGPGRRVDPPVHLRFRPRAGRHAA